MRAPDGAPEAFYRDVVLPYAGDDCLIWPFARNTGYASMKHGKGMVLVHRRLCTEINGPPPTPKHDAAHSCGRGKQGCVAKGHLSWKTRAENEADKVNHGTSNRGERCGASVLTEADVFYLRSLPRTYDRRAESDRLGVGLNTISEARTGKTWGHLARVSREENEKMEQRLGGEILDGAGKPKSQSQIAQEKLEEAKLA